MSRFIISLLLFVAVNLLAAKALFRVEADNHRQSSHAQEQTWTEWAVDDFEKQAQPAPIIILGSSLVLTPVNLADANYLNAPVNGALHHRSDLLNSLLATSQQSGTSNFNFALPGLMPSDAYLITKFLLSKGEEHKLIIYGVGPRDFVDNLLASPASTDPYRCLSKYFRETRDEKTKFCARNWQAQLENFFGCYLPLLENRGELLTQLYKQSQNEISILTTILAPNTTLTKLTVAHVHSLLPDYNPMSINISQAIFLPNPKMDPERFTRNLNEYKLRYGKVNWDTFACQSQFFLDFLKTAREKNINVLVLAMPVTSVNRQLLPEYVFTAYKQNLSVLTKTYGATFIDLDSSGKFSDEDFGDTVHLSTTGSIKLIHAIAESIAQYKLLEVHKTDRKRLAVAGLKI